MADPDLSNLDEIDDTGDGDAYGPPLPPGYKVDPETGNAVPSIGSDVPFGPDAPEGSTVDAQGNTVVPGAGDIPAPAPKWADLIEKAPDLLGKGLDTAGKFSGGGAQTGPATYGPPLPPGYTRDPSTGNAMAPAGGSGGGAAVVVGGVLVVGVLGGAAVLLLRRKRRAKKGAL